eukprot:TRINITY_DN2622_c0_g1_i1.p1 TRINITY_DN2622_c0_g1~~TRINITY_DN2622_c0_g1_i1.p1  ORF type:complete len:533 (+),score=176.58 TRINITY_DN2622_c0_g1_i1:139-1599(+)
MPGGPNSVAGFLHSYIAAKNPEPSARQTSLPPIRNSPAVVASLRRNSRVEKALHAFNHQAARLKVKKALSLSRSGSQHAVSSRERKAAAAGVGPPRAFRNTSGGWTVSLRRSPPPPAYRLPLLPEESCPDVFLTELSHGPMLGTRRELLRRPRSPKAQDPPPPPTSPVGSPLHAASRASSDGDTPRGRLPEVHSALSSNISPPPKVPWRRSLHDIVPEPCIDALRTRAVSGGGRTATTVRRSASEQRAAQRLWRELDEFEAKHPAITRDAEAAMEGGARAIGQFKTGRVMQLVGLQRTPLPLLFKDVTPAEVQRIYVGTVGGLDQRMTKDTFGLFLAKLMHPEPPLPDDTVSHIFRVVDASGDGKVDFVEFSSTVFFLIAPKAAQRTLRQLYWYLDYVTAGKVGKAQLAKGAVTAAVRDAHGQQQEQLRTKTRAQLSSTTAWRTWAEQLEAAAADLGETDVLSLQEFAALVFLNDALFYGIQTLFI